MRRLTAVWLVVMLAATSGAAWAQGPGWSKRPVTFGTQWNVDRARPGDSRVLALEVQMQPGWHINPNPAQAVSVGDFHPLPTTVTVQGVQGLHFGATQFPSSRSAEVIYANATLQVFEGKVVFYLPVVVDPQAAVGEVPVAVEVFYQACDERVCMPPQTHTLETTLIIVEPGAPIVAAPTDSALFEGFDPAGFAQVSNRLKVEAGAEDSRQAVDFYFFTLTPSDPVGLLALWCLAALGGALLNFTPCVLPVIPIKIMGLAKSAGNRRRCLALGLSMSLGVVAFWLVMGSVIVTIAGFTSVNQLFQYPWFTIGLGVFIAAMSVGMSGWFTMKLPGFVYAVSPKHDSHVGSFGFGIMTAVLSTPCTGPFMGAAAGWAALQPSGGIALITFGFIGVGMALPYLVLSTWPRLVDHMPRTGPASELVKQVMALLMGAAGAYFVGVGLLSLTADGSVEPSSLYWLPVAALIAAAGFWLAYRTFRITARWGWRGVFVSVGLLMVLLAGGLGSQAFQRQAGIHWVYYTPARFEEALKTGHVVMMDFTAEWCLNCKVLESTVLQTDAVIEALAREQVVAMKVDLTGNNPLGNAMLQQVDRITIPLLVVFAPDGSEVFKADLYRAEQVVAALDQARKAQ